MKIISKEYQKSIEKNLKDMSYELKNITQGKKSTESLASDFTKQKKEISKMKTGQLRLSSLENRKKKRMRKMNRGLKTSETPSSVPIYAYTFWRNPRTQEKGSERIREEIMGNTYHNDE